MHPYLSSSIRPLCRYQRPLALPISIQMDNFVVSHILVCCKIVYAIHVCSMKGRGEDSGARGVSRSKKTKTILRDQSESRNFGFSSNVLRTFSYHLLAGAIFLTTI